MFVMLIGFEYECPYCGGEGFRDCECSGDGTCGQCDGPPVECWVCGGGGKLPNCH